MEQNKIPKRSEIPVEETWDLTGLYATAEEWEADAQKIAALPKKLAAFAGHLAESGDKLLEWFRLQDALSLQIERLYGYAHLLADTDVGNGENQARKGKAINLLVALQSASAFAQPEIMAISDETLESFFAQCKELEEYRLLLHEMRRRKNHILSAPEEKLLAAAGEMSEAPDTIGGVFRNADLKFPDVEAPDGTKLPLTQGSFIPYMESSDRELRRRVFETFYDTWASHGALSAAILDAQLKQQTFYARMRGYETNRQAALDRTNVPETVYDNLIQAVHRHLPTMYRYMMLRQKLMGLEQLHMYDLYNPILAGENAVIPYSEAQQAVLSAVKPLGEEYVAVVRRAFGQRWIDVRENQGKRGGAYSSGLSRPHPFILLNHKDTLDSQFTLVHEVGHTMHSYLSAKNQPTAYADYVIFVAEVASTCNEVLMMQDLLAKTTDKQRRAYLINHFLDQFRTTLYRQTMFAEFEHQINCLSEAGESLTSDKLDEMYYNLNKLYYGEEMVVDERIAHEWARIPHFYYDFYVYQYATGFSAAIALAMKILKEGQPAVDAYLQFLSGGCSADPISLLKIAGVDMSTPQPVEQALQLFSQLLDEMEQLMA